MTQVENFSRRHHKHGHGEFHRKKFHVVCMVSNPALYASRWTLYRQFAEHMEESNVQLHTVELQLGDRPFVVTDHCNPYHTQLRYWDEIWLKENALNIGIQKLSQTNPDWEYVAWIDADIVFLDPKYDWVQHAIHQLQVYKVIQLFETAVDLGPNGEALTIAHSFMSRYIKNHCFHPEQAYHEWHPGYAWAARREFFEEDGPGQLLDRCALGAGDRHMALALCGMAEKSFVNDMHSDYAKYILQWQDICEHTIQRDVGYLPTSIAHYHHGAKKHRYYFNRWQILVKNHYRPMHDLKKTHTGLLHFHNDHTVRFRRLRDEIREYFRSRNEDSLEK